jgi:hypothetical protein
MRGTFVEVAVGPPGTDGDGGLNRLTREPHGERARLYPNQPHANRVRDLLGLRRGNPSQKYARK